MTQKNRTRDLTVGSPMKLILSFAAPLLFGFLFQQFYSFVDTAIVGKYLGASKLAAVGSTGSVNFLVLGFCQGACSGFAIPIAQAFGARDEHQVRKCVAASTYLSAGVSFVIAALTGWLCPAMLRLMNTPEAIIADSVAYIRIIFLGIPVTILYNMASGILRSLGDSRTPVYFLVLASLVNVVLDLVLIVYAGMGVAGAAVATIISQMLSAILSLIRLMRTDSSIRVRLRAIRFDRPILGRMIRIGIPSGLQNSIIGFSNVVIQSYINAYGEFAMAGIGAYTKVEGFAFIPITSFSMALTTFVSQNLGAGEAGRVKKGVRFGGLTGILMAVVIGILTVVFAPQLIGAFNSNPEVIAYGVARARIVCPFFCLVSFSHLMAAILRGYGKANVPMIDFLVCWCVIRILIIAVGGLFIHSIYLTYWVYPITWTLSTLTMGIYYRKEEDELTRCSQNLRGI